MLARFVGQAVTCYPASVTTWDVWLSTGRDAWPEVELEEPQAFIRHVEALHANGGGPDASRAGDLYLAFACGAGVESAHRAFDRAFRPTLERVHGSWRNAPVDCDDFVQSVWERVFSGEPPRIRSYAGRGSLAAWVKMVAVRWMADRARRGRAPAHDDLVLVTQMCRGPEVTTKVLQHRHRDDVRTALESALGSLTRAQRLLLRQRFLAGMPLADLGRLYGVNRVTVSKRLARARRDCMAAGRDQLRDVLSDGASADEVARLCLSQLDLTLSRVLRSTPAAAASEA